VRGNLAIRRLGDQEHSGPNCQVTKSPSCPLITEGW
jgi:hypothetical protein